MAFTAKDVAALRQTTGCGMMDCKKALTECDGDMDKAVEKLREKGLAAAEKKAGRIAAEGIAYSKVNADNTVGVVIEVNSETDFVAKNSDFQVFVEQIADTVIAENPSDVDDLLTKTLVGSNDSVEEVLREKILKIGENMKIRRFTRYEGAVVSYIHAGGRIGVLVKIEADDAVKNNAGFVEMGKDVAMQIAALNPLYLDKASVPASVIEKEKEILIAQIKNDPKNANKPEQIVEKMVVGRINKYYENNCLLQQSFVKDGNVTVAQFVEAQAKEFGGNATVVDFVRYEKGEGLAKKEDNFADEVANMVK